MDSAIATTYVMPVGMVRAAFARDPDLLLVADHDRSRILATDSALARLYDEFDAVAEILGTARRSLFAASVLWLTYLAERNTTTTFGMIDYENLQSLSTQLPASVAVLSFAEAGDAAIKGRVQNLPASLRDD